ncbi:mitochondrial carrier [Parathielavia appendiculata]|uniref:Mitochondrial carrier n=1 Tax=Parathielavia appendiculata TaxID=2587402 RepID=A0AAN6U0V6_9PEZI|nr:mitochondrial carrier [Parathielavia appendiculata]
MSADFWAGYISGAAGIILGNPLDVLKVRLQAGSPPSPSQPPPPSTSLLGPSTAATRSTHSSSYLRPFLLGTAVPVLGYGALNALLFVSYNRTESFLNRLSAPGAGGDAAGGQGRGTDLLTTWLAGAVGGLATWVVSTPTELVKCRAQLQVPSSSSALSCGPGLQSQPPPHGTSSPSPTSSWHITTHLLRTTGLRGLYVGGTVTALRDSIGYGFYFWGYELCSRWWDDALFLLPSSSSTTTTTTTSSSSHEDSSTTMNEAARVLLCGGLAGIITWASIFPLDVVKTRVQTQRTPLLGDDRQNINAPLPRKRLGAWDMAKETYREGGLRPFFRGLGVCSVRAFIVNAVQWAVYEWIMVELGQGRRKASRQEG